MAKRKPKLLYELQEPNDHILDCGFRLCDMVKSPMHNLFSTSYRRGAISWLDAEAFERACEEDKKLARALDIAQRGKYTDVQLKRIQKELTRIFEEVHLVDIVEKFHQVLPRVRDYVAARHAGKSIAAGRDPKKNEENA